MYKLELNDFIKFKNYLISNSFNAGVKSSHRRHFSIN